MNPQEFVSKWKKINQSERSVAHSHFINLCAMLGQPAPTDADRLGDDYKFEKGVIKTGGAKDGKQGWADVWFKDHFAWEYKKKHSNLKKAYDQLSLYRENLLNPPLLIVCDLHNFEIHTNFTGTAKKVYEFSLDNLAEKENLDILRRVFTDPYSFKADAPTTSEVTEKAAREFAKLADLLRKRGVPADESSHFLIRLLFCLFAEDVGLLPNHLFSTMLDNFYMRPIYFNHQLRILFGEMNTGGSFGAVIIPHFNGGLFDDNHIIELSAAELDILHKVSKLDWSSIEPAILGTLFERTLDPTKRSQLGAHYTSKEDILLIVEPVLMQPLRREWRDIIQPQALDIAAKRDVATGTTHKTKRKTKLDESPTSLLLGFADKIAKIRVLDPACGSGNFLYVALKQMLDLQKEVIIFAGDLGLQPFFPSVSPTQLHGIEVNEYAHELAQATIWIGYIQWLRDNGFGSPGEPILRQIDAIIRMDAILAYDEAGNPVEPEWPEADIIIGNPPFLGGNRIRNELGDIYVDNLFKLYIGRVPAFADLVCYWFERTRQLIENGKVKRAGLLATQAIRGGANREVLKHIKETGDIFFAWADRDWVLNGAAVHVSMVGFDSGDEQIKDLDGTIVTNINPDLTSLELDVTKAKRLNETSDICFMGPSPKAPFDIDERMAHIFLKSPINVNGRFNSDVIRPVASAMDLVQRTPQKWTLDFGLLSLDTASLYEKPFEYAKNLIYPIRSQNRRAAYAQKWWQYAEPRPGMRLALKGKARFIATPAVAKHRIFVWVEAKVLCNQGTLVFAREDDYFFGVLHSKLHEMWALKMGTQLEDRPRYTPTTTFETFPFPYVPGKEPSEEAEPKVKAIADAARELVRLRDNWLNPPGLTDAAELKKRTLTNLYNQRPTWLDNIHQKLDKAVLDAYSWSPTITNEEILEKLLELNLQRANSL